MTEEEEVTLECVCARPLFLTSLLEEEVLVAVVVVRWLAPPAECAPLLVDGDVAALLLSWRDQGKRFFIFPISSSHTSSSAKLHPATASLQAVLTLSARALLTPLL